MFKKNNLFGLFLNSSNTAINNDKDIFPSGNNARNVKLYKKPSKSKQEHIQNPSIRKECYYGLVGEIVGFICEGTEALPEATAIELMSLLSVSLESGNVYIPFGSTHTVIRLNAILAAQTSSGKGISSSQLKPFYEYINEAYPDLLCPIFRGGISTPEGIINRIRDDNYVEDRSLTPSTGSKLFVIDEEFSRIFTLSSSASSTLSNCLRTLYDGSPVEPLTKYNMVGCAKPHVAIYGHITPEELLTVVKPVDVYNGFLNRYPIYHAQRLKSIPFPEPISAERIKVFADKLASVVEWGNSEQREMNYSECYKSLWTEKYEYLRSLGKGDSVEAALLGRAAHYTTMYSMLFAILDKVEVITAAHLKASLAWVDYWHQSVRYIFGTAGKKIEQEKSKERAEKVLEVIKREIKANNGESIGKTPITKTFSGKYSAKEINEALEDLRATEPPKIRVTKQKRNAMEIELC